MKHRPKLPLQVPPLPNHDSSPSLERRNNLSDRESAAVAIAKLFYELQAAAVATGLTCKIAPNEIFLRRTAERGIERAEGLLKEIEKEAEKL